MNEFETKLQELAIAWIHGKKVEPQILEVLKEAIVDTLCYGGGGLQTENFEAEWTVEEEPLNVIGLELRIKDFDDDWREEIDLWKLQGEIDAICAETEQEWAETRFTERLMSY